MNFDNVNVYDYGHLGLVAGFIKQVGLIDYIDHVIPKTKPYHVCHGQAVAAMLLNALGFHSQALYLVPEYFSDKPIDLLISPGIYSKHLNDDVLGRTLDTVFDYGVSSLYSELAIKTLNTLKIPPKAINLDFTSFHVDGTAYNDNTPGDTDKFIRIVQGYSRDHRPELNQAIVALITENQAGIPIYLEVLSGNAEDKSTFQDIIKSQLDSLKAAENSQHLIADSALYTKATIQSLNEKNRYFITRVSSVSNDAKAVNNRPDLTA
ncbi:IS1634 family transposase [Thorsellia kenyensis]|uniref:IS1634 family transposase n=1 Tax=Thorsellia kenyensis TaxID=1549888 RepID=A0ABV6C806_9GAMM